MRDIISWLMNVESLAGVFYREVSEEYADDRKIADFFRVLSVEEGLHLQVMKDALQFLADKKEGVSPITLDDSTKEKIETVFSAGSELLASGELDREKLLACLVTAEFSEWNDFFLYAVNLLKEQDLAFMRASATIQRHVREIERFLEELPEGQKHLHVIRCLPPVWQEKILIVEDQEAVLEFLKAVLKHEGATETARNGKEALARVKETYFDVIVSDVSMPEMNGIEFYKKAAKFDSGIGSRFLFLPGRRDDRDFSFFERNKLRYLLKPAPIREIKRHVDEILRKVRERQ